ncbi:interferon alpha/beta receptor 2-like [Toxotes jaculatrix]|uniref:interferon alpha/beta receptor 2-like n=1 Tax=Toxotes jaculatrix TaxID=941984 RepID=UPI001B3A7C45|nr:interferon alpha/beta receptor 2-like [Toxotes jaculatrix]XP_040913017.1 interferon alpha/beta receptor 2-like [Toxotes jaculatrix]
MNCLPLILYLVLLLDYVFSSLPAPVNVSVISVNFHHVLRWDPGPGTPPGTQYRIFKRVNGRKKKQRLSSVSTTSFKMTFKKKEHPVTYYLTVQAFYNHTLSPESSKYAFSPYTDTIIGPPTFSLAGCGNCIQMNISLPEADRSSGIDDILRFYDAHFRVLLRRDKKVDSDCEIRSKSYTFSNLKEGVEYCIQVHTMIRVNRNTQPSAWKCTFTSIVEPHRDPLILGGVAAFVSLVVGILMTSLSCLYYTGFLCKFKAPLPGVLIPTRRKGCTLTPEETTTDPVHIILPTEKQREHNNHTMPHPATVDSEEEEEVMNGYMFRDTQFSSGDSLCWGNSKAAVSEDYKLSAEVEIPDTEFDVGVVHEGLDEDEAEAEDAKVSFTPGEGQNGLQDHVTGEEEAEEEMNEEEEWFDSSGDVNLFSVTLSALCVDEEEQNTRDSLTDLLKLSDLETLLPTIPKGILNHTDSQTESHDQTTVELIHT